MLLGSQTQNTPTQTPATETPSDRSTEAPAPAKRVLPFVNHQEREANRALPTSRVLELLRRWQPKQYALAEVVGQWIWITFNEQPAEKVRADLSQLGFHWNNSRKCWQHPCGQFATEGSDADPRQKYGSHFAADLKAA
jgi:hypothetical protein